VRSISQPDGHDFPGLIDELVPDFASMVDDVQIAPKMVAEAVR
jgi:hypothetical protein